VKNRKLSEEKHGNSPGRQFSFVKNRKLSEEKHGNSPGRQFSFVINRKLSEEKHILDEKEKLMNEVRKSH